LPAVLGGKRTSSLRLVRTGPGPAAKFQFSFAGIALFLREFKHWKTVGICMIPFVLVAGALVAASVSARRQAASAPAPVPATVIVDPQALDKLTDLTRADQLVQQRLAAVNRASTACQKASQTVTALHNQRRGAASPAALKGADQAVSRANQALANARKDFDAAFAQYQKLGGAVDYRQQLP